MRKYFVYLMFYSVGGFILERIINLIFYGQWYDNSVLYGPYQPLYGSGVLITIFIYDYFITKLQKKDIVKDMILIIVAIVATGLVEAITGYGYEYLFGTVLWNYGEFFPCNLNYVCVIPTSLFGFLSFLVVKYFHPLIKWHLAHVNKWLVYSLLVIFVTDIVFTLINLLG